MGAISDRIGRKKVLMVGLLFFGLCSTGAALSVSTEMLIAMRALMGIGGAIIMPSTLSILTATFREPKERAKAIALWAGTFPLGAGLGPLIGGLLLDHFSWSSVFYINIPVVIVAFFGCYYFLADSRDELVRRIDVPGALLSIAGLFALVYGIIQAGVDGWDATNVIYSFAAAAVLLGIFAWWEMHSSHAMLPLRFFKNMSFTGANLALTLVMFAMFGIMFFVAQYLQSVLGYSPLQAGVRMLPFAVVAFPAAVMSAPLAQRIGTKMTVGLGILLAAAGQFYLSQVCEADTTYPILLVGLCITALGMGTTMSPATNSIMGSVPVSKAGIGSAMNDTTRQIGGALGVAVLGTIMNSVYISQIKASQLIAALPESVSEAIESSIQGAHKVAQGIPDASLSQAIVDLSSKAFTSGMVEGMLIGGIIMAVASIITMIILPSRVRPANEEV
jgi:EmrB/QacA subfamily drug resistance transporter